MATFSYTPSYSTSLKQKPKIIEAKFGDGYEQATTMGINVDPEQWGLKFTNASKATVDAIIAFFLTNSVATTPFTWVNPDGVSGRYKCKEWARTYGGYEVNGLTCKFEEVFW